MPSLLLGRLGVSVQHSSPRLSVGSHHANIDFSIMLVDLVIIKMILQGKNDWNIAKHLPRNLDN